MRELPGNDRLTIGEITITLAKLNHPDPVYGFRLEHGGQSITAGFAASDGAPGVDLRRTEALG